MKNKIEIIESISHVSELINIVNVILESSGISVEKKDSSKLIAKISIPSLGNQQQLFLFTTDYLGGNIDEAPFVKEIEKDISLNSFNAIVIVSSKNITNGFQSKIKGIFRSVPITFWGREDIVTKINEQYSDFWKHNDQELIAYEKFFLKTMEEDWGIKKIKQFKSAHSKLLEIFIEPRLLRKVTDRESPKKAYERITVDKLKESTKTIALEGEPGSGKTRLLKQLGIDYLNSNNKNLGNKYLPIFLNNIDLIENKRLDSNLISLITAIEKKVLDFFIGRKLMDLANTYKVVVLIDSIDEFDEENQIEISNDLKILCDLGVKVLFGTRFQDYSTIHGINKVGHVEEVNVEKFNENQIRHFLEKYFQSDKSKAYNLIESLKENSIIQRLPITPLTLSLISILYEENNFEIPATITDVYDNFNNLLLGRSMPDSRFDFFDITIKERILSAYAYELLKRNERSYMTVEEFNLFFKNFFNRVSGSVNLDLLPEALDHIIANTGILVLQDRKYVKFLHESYLEYYASKEIFYYVREKGEQELVDNFFDMNWQFTSIFYAGRVKEMDTFLIKIIEKARSSRKVPDMFKSIGGLGYLIQALYLTDDQIRKDAISVSLIKVIDLYEWMKKLSSDDVFFFKDLPMPTTALVNAFFFFDYHNSITIKKPLELAYDELRTKLESEDDLGNKIFDPNIAYRLFILALTLSSPRLNNLEKIKDLVYNTTILNDPLFERLLDMGVTIAGSKDLYELKNSINKLPKGYSSGSKIISIGQGNGELFLSGPVGRYRYTDYDRIHAERAVEIITEGKTDAQIIEHAFYVLTDTVPYWSIQPIHEEKGGANELAKCLANSGKIVKNNKILIGLFDNDEKGIQEFRGTLTKDKFSEVNGSCRLKKHNEADIYGLKLPVPPEMQHFINSEQKFNFFSIEHYFPYDFLLENGMIKDNQMNDTYRIKDDSTAKTNFSKFIRTINDSEIFKNFFSLFKEIDSIANVDYIEYKF